MLRRRPTIATAPANAAPHRSGGIDQRVSPRLRDLCQRMLREGMKSVADGMNLIGLKRGIGKAVTQDGRGADGRGDPEEVAAVKAPGSPQNHVGRHRGAHQRQLIARTLVSSSRTSPLAMLGNAKRVSITKPKACGLWSSAKARRLGIFAAQSLCARRSILIAPSEYGCPTRMR